MSPERDITPELVVDVWEARIPTNLEIIGTLGLLDELAVVASNESKSDDRDIDIARFWLSATPADIDYPDRWARWKINSTESSFDLSDLFPVWTEIAGISRIGHVLNVVAKDFWLKGTKSELSMSTTEDGEEITDHSLIPSVTFDVVDADTILIPEIQTPNIGDGGSEREILYKGESSPGLSHLYEEAHFGYIHRREHLRRFNRMRIGTNDTPPSMVFSLAVAAKIFANNGFTTIKVPLEMPLRDELGFISKGDSSERIQGQMINVLSRVGNLIDGVTCLDEDEYGYATLSISSDMHSENNHLDQVLRQI